eukprot:CAMPEP_0184670590 /NCGR_PEP_ID=MMETSP0308-20130426/82837_1 /TAXON_ID=38269 /ORGANISM="Gloeochaete witrockiana, Strain SAG 46.84" /LENGTH=374 /DNA_ID=CAMNT_0027117383 /DNA_START=201 /DNA_END=1325 /DNA_ORIENTATION=-
MTSKNFFKLCSDCKIITKSLDKTRADLIFAQVKPKGGHTINFPEFQNAILQIAKHKSQDVQEVIAQICYADGPSSNATATSTGGVYAKLTDSSQYTGAHKERFNADGTGKGLAGRDSVAKGHGSANAYAGGNVQDLSQITRMNLNGGSTDLPARRNSLGTTSNARGASPTRSASPSRANEVRSKSPSQNRPVPPVAMPSPARGNAKETKEMIYSIFVDFIGISDKSEMMDGAKWKKLCTDCKLIGSTDADLIFAQAKNKGERKLSFAQFEHALQLVANKAYPELGPDEALSGIKNKIMSSGGPSLNGATKARTDGIYSKLTDTSGYTGMYAERFNSDGTGKGLAGSDVGARGTGSAAQYRGGDVKDISQIVCRR